MSLVSASSRLRALTALLVAVVVAALPSLVAAPAAAADPGAPGTPQSVTARAGVNQAKVYWTPPAEADPAVDRYVVTSAPEGRTCTALATARSCQVTGLTNGQAYTFTVTAENAAGSSDPSAPTSPVTPAADTTAPVLVSSSVTPRRVPASGGTVTVELHITDDLSGRAAPSGALDANPAVLFSKGVGGASVGFTRSVNRISGDEYDGIYRATITIPGGTASGDWELVVYPIRDNADNSTSFLRRDGLTVGSPTAPTNVVATAGTDRQVSVSWDAPGDNGGNIITGYEVTALPGGRIFETTTTSLEASFADWPVDEPLTFSVVAINAGGRSEPSAESAPIQVPAGRPGTPTVEEVHGADTRLQVTWSAPTSTGGDDDLTYTATASPGGASCTTAELSCSIEGLTNGTTYDVTVTAANSAGTGEPSAVVSGRVAALPAAPAAPWMSVLASGPSAAVAVAHFSETTDDGGAPVTAYTVTARTPDGEVADTCTSPAEPYCALRNLEDGVTYTVEVAAHNASGVGAASAATSWTADLVGPVVSVDGPAWASTLTGRGVVDFRATDATGVMRYGARARVLVPGEREQTFDRSFMASRFVLAIKPGTTVCARALAFDSNGVPGDFSDEACRTAPIDDTAMKRAGKTRTVKGGYFGRSATELRTKGAALTVRKVRAGAAELVVATGKSGGKVGVYYGKKRVKVVNLRSAKTVRQKVVALPDASGARTITIRSLTGRPTVVDGLALQPR